MKATITLHRKAYGGSIGPAHQTIEAEWPSGVPLPSLEEHVNAQHGGAVMFKGVFRLPGDRYTYQVYSVTYGYEIENGTVRVQRVEVHAVSV